MEADLEFANPFNIKLSVEEIEDSHLGSFRAKGETTLKFMSGNFHYFCENLWFEYSKIDDFANRLRSLVHGVSKTPALLSDMSNEFVYSIGLDEIDIKVDRQIEVITTGNLYLRVDSSAELVQLNYRAMNEFPKWW